MTKRQDRLQAHLDIYTDDHNMKKSGDGGAEGFIIKDKLKGASLSYCIPRALSETAKQIYTIFGKDYPKRSYKLEEKK